MKIACIAVVHYLISKKKKVRFKYFRLKISFNPPEGWCESSSQEVQLILFPFISVGNGSGGFKFTGVRGLFEILKMFYPPKGRLLADSCRGPIVFTYVLFWVSKTLETFQFTCEKSPKKIPENVLSPEGTSACRLL